MNPDFLDCLCDPETGAPLRLETHKAKPNGSVETGVLHGSRRDYPIVRGVPRFAGYQEHGSYARSFSYQWSKWSRVQFESENVGKPMEGHTRRMWEKICSNAPPDMTGHLIGDFGCGPGRFVEVARERGARVIGVDYSDAVEAAAENFADDPQVLICQGDILKPPIRAGVLNGAFCIGVLHHTPDPRTGLRQISERLMPGGWLGLAVYSRNGFYDFPAVTAWRTLFRVLWPLFRHYPPLIYSYLTGYGIAETVGRIPVIEKAIRTVLPYRRLADPRWTVLETFDGITPSHQSTHMPFEVFAWLKSAGLTEIEPSDWGFTSFNATKPSKQVPLTELSAAQC